MLPSAGSAGTGAGVDDHQARAAGRGVVAGQPLERVQRTPHPQVRLAVAPGPARDHRLLHDQGRRVHRVPLEQRPRPHQRPVRVAVLAEQVERVRAPLVELGEVLRVDRTEPAAGGERAPEVARRVDVRVHLHRPFAGEPPVAPRLVPAMGLVVVEREHADSSSSDSPAAPRSSPRRARGARAGAGTTGPRTLRRGRACCGTGARRWVPISPSPAGTRASASSRPHRARRRRGAPDRTSCPARRRSAASSGPGASRSISPPTSDSTESGRAASVRPPVHVDQLEQEERVAAGAACELLDDVRPERVVVRRDLALLRASAAAGRSTRACARLRLPSGDGSDRSRVTRST